MSPLPRISGRRQQPESSPATKIKVDRICRSCRRHRRGATFVEFALVGPVFFLFVFGMIEFGRMVMVQQILVSWLPSPMFLGGKTLQASATMRHETVN